MADLRAWTRDQRAAGRRIGLVPTMGALHEGHLALVDAARRRSDAVVMSVFVNPLQFGPEEDLTRYPRDLARDRSLAEARGVDAVFAPTEAMMYPPGSSTRVVPGPAAERWEGAARPGHFTGVLTVVAKLFHLAEPDVACFGQKDFQQAVLVRQMVRDLDWPLELAVVPTVREPDGLALSTRNVYLDDAGRRNALGLSAALGAAHQAWREGERGAPAIDARARGVLEEHPGLAIEYVAVADPETLEPVSRASAETIVALAGRVGRTRLIDNIILGQGLD
ncbi:MAG: pantoate--beta-alanine ligase [Gemmatimonadales bacterium]|nr:pantoate--beta-alanine ligase [Gemmatimonadales bacterium]